VLYSLKVHQNPDGITIALFWNEDPTSNRSPLIAGFD